MRVVDAAGKPPTIPFWTGEAPARTAELSREVSRCTILDERLAAGDGGGAGDWLRGQASPTTPPSSRSWATWRRGGRCWGSSPPMTTWCSSGSSTTPRHAPGDPLALRGRVNQALGLALRKRFCTSFNFELQAAANDDAVVISLGRTVASPWPTPRFLSTGTVRTVLTQAILDSPMFQSRWRWNLNRPGRVAGRVGRRNPPPIQRMESDDLMAALSPRRRRQENITGPIEIPDHPLVRQTVHDTLTEGLDIEGLTDLLDGVETGRVRVHFGTPPRRVGARPRDPDGQALCLPRRRRGDRPPHQTVALRRGLPVEPHHRAPRPGGHRPGGGRGRARTPHRRRAA